MYLSNQDKNQLQFVINSVPLWFYSPHRFTNICVHHCSGEVKRHAYAARPECDVKTCACGGSAIRHVAEAAVDELTGHVAALTGKRWTAKAPLPGGDFPVTGAAALKAAGVLQ